MRGALRAIAVKWDTVGIVDNFANARERTVDGDRPIKRREDDRLGFAPVADHLARAIVDQPAKDGLVFGIEGKWGSGKSTLINLTIEALKSHGDAGPEVIAFSPWLVGDRDDLLRSLFDELAAAAVKIDPIEIAVADAGGKSWLPAKLRWSAIRNEHWRLRRKEQLRNSLGGKLRAFGWLAGSVGKLARMAGSFGLVGGNLVATAVESGGEAASQFLASAPVAKRKTELVEALALLSRRIAIFIDDLDRLEPREASEVLRLIRAVADFPNVIYVLSYDPAVVADTLTKSVQVDDGAAFLEKIVQVSFGVPRPEAFDLRRWFQAEVYQLFAEEIERRLFHQRLAQVIDVQGGRYLKTGRDIVRTMNALRLHAIPVRSRIDIPDMVWLQLIKIGNPTFYAWIEEYLTEAAAIAAGATATHDAPQMMAGRLEEILTKELLNIDLSMIELEEVLPGLDPGGGDGRDRERLRVFNDLRGEGINRFVSSGRLGSPEHYRYYFAFAHPAGALSDEQVQAFIEVAGQAPNEATQMLAKFIEQLRPQGGTMAEVLIDRLTTWADRIPGGAILGIITSLAHTMDDAALSAPAGDFGQHGAWVSAERAVTVLLKRATADVRELSLIAIFEEGRALGWATQILRDEIFSHGHYGDHAQPEQQWLLSASEFRDVLVTMLRRYRETPAAELMRVPELISLLYAWKQGSGTEEARAWVAAQTETDDGFFAFLSCLRSWAANSELGVYRPLKRRNLIDFLDYDHALRRLDGILLSEDASEHSRKLASELLEAAKQDRGY